MNHMVEIRAVQFYSLNLEPGINFANNWDGEGWFSLIDKKVHNRNFAMVCFEKSLSWDKDKNQHNFIRLGTNETRCKSVLRIVKKADLNKTSDIMQQLSTGKYLKYCKSYIDQ